MFRQFFDTSFNDYRQVRVVLQELPENRSREPSKDFQRFCASIFHHKNFTYEQFKIEYCYVRENLIVAEGPLNDIQLYRRPFAFIFFAICRTSEELRMILDEYAKIKQREKGVYLHLFIRYRTNEHDTQDDLSYEEQMINGNHFTDYDQASRPSMSSMGSIDSSQSLSVMKTQDSSSTDGNGSLGSDRASLTESANSAPVFSATTTEVENNGTSKNPTKFSIFKDKNGTTGSLFHLFDSDLKRTFHRLEANLTKHVLESEKSNIFESRGFNNYASSIDSQLMDIRLMIDCEKDCSLLENQGKYRHRYFYDRASKSVLNELDMRVMFNVLNQYIEVTANLTNEAGRNRLQRRVLEIRTTKRKGDCCLLLGAIEKAYTDYQNVADALRSHNDPMWQAGALEASIAASYCSTQKPKRRLQRTMSILRPGTLNRIERYLSRSNSPILLKYKMELALQIYNTHTRAIFDPVKFRLELDASLRWCSLLWEQNELEKYQEEITEYIFRINDLGAKLTEHIDSAYLNAYLAEIYALVGLKRKSALYYRAAAFSGLTLLNEQASYNDELSFFVDLIKKARIGYGIEDNQLIFPLVQKVVINESIQISLKNEDFITTVQNVHFAIESLIGHMAYMEIVQFLTLLNDPKQSTTCSYRSIPRLISLDILPLSIRLEAWKAKPKSDIFIFHQIKALPSQHQSLQRKVDFFWVKNEQSQIAIEIENYLPAPMAIDRLEFLTDNQLWTRLETRYRISDRTKKRLIIDCIPKEVGELQIRGLRYHIWSNNYEFYFEDFPNLRQCACSIHVVDELPILDLQALSINGNSIEPSSTSTVYNAQIYHGENVFVTLELINVSRECDINTLEIEALVHSSFMTDSIKILELNLPILVGQTAQMKIDLTNVYDRFFSIRSRLISNTKVLPIELRINYTNESTSGQGYYRRNIVDLCLDYSSAVTFKINDLQNDEEDSSYLMICAIENHISEELLVGNQVIPSPNSSLIPIKQEKIKLNAFSSNTNQLITDVRDQLPRYIYYQTAVSNKQLRLPNDLKYFTDENIQNHLGILVQSPFDCYWHFQQIVNTLHINLCVQSQFDQLEKLEFQFLLTKGIRFLNSNKILFNNTQPGEYLTAERILIFSPSNPLDVLSVDVTINGIQWKRITLTLPNK